MSGRYWIDCPVCKELIPYTDDEPPECECGWSAEKEIEIQKSLMENQVEALERDITTVNGLLERTITHL